MKPSMENIGKPAIRLVTQLPNVTIIVSLQAFVRHKHKVCTDQHLTVKKPCQIYTNAVGCQIFHGLIYHDPPEDIVVELIVTGIGH